MYPVLVRDGTNACEDATRFLRERGTLQLSPVEFRSRILNNPTVQTFILRPKRRSRKVYGFAQFCIRDSDFGLLALDIPQDVKSSAQTFFRRVVLHLMETYPGRRW